MAQTIAETLRRLAAAPVAYSPADRCFVVPGVGRKRGLTKILNAIMPVPHGEPASDAPPRKRARRSRNDPVPAPVVWRHDATTRHYIARAAPSCRDATAACQLEQFDDAAGRSGIGHAYNTRHGSLVDEQLKLRVASGRAAFADRTHGAMRGGLDPCTATLLDYFRAHGRRIVAAQVPLYSAEMDVATAFDVMTDDGAVYEIKSTAVTSADAVERGDRRYETPRARLTRTALRGAPCSPYALGQVQLYITCAIVAETTGAAPPHAAVLRVSPGVVRQYDLNPWFRTRADRLRRAVAQRTGQHRRNVRARRFKQQLRPA